MEQERLWKLIVLKLTREASEAELLELQRLAQENPALSLYLQTLGQLQTGSPDGKAGPASDPGQWTPEEVGEAYQRLMARVATGETTVDESTVPETGRAPGRDSVNRRKTSFSRRGGAANGMLTNYCKIAWRNLLRDKVYSLVNIGGLSIGIAVCLLITLYVTHEYSYDSFHRNAGRIYSVDAKMKMDGGDYFDYPLVSYNTGPALLREDPDVESFVRTPASFGENPIITNPQSPDKKFQERGMLFADSNFFQYYSFPLREGDPGQVLARPFSIVLSERMARKYFGDADPIGGMLKYDSTYIFTVTGVAAEAPSNSTVRYDFVASLSSQLSMPAFKPHREDQAVVSSGNFATSILLKKGADPKKTETILRRLAALNPDKSDSATRYALLPLPSMHLSIGGFDQSNTKYLQIFILAGGLILLLALINYMSLATAKATLRAKEIGVRKVIGAGRPSIARQFYVESALYAGIAFVLGFILFRLAQPYFFDRIQLSIDSSFLYNPRVLGMFLALLLATIFIAGSYPSFVLSSFNPVTVLYGRFSKQQGGSGIRKFFLVLQFSLSVGMIISSLVIQKQMYFFRHTDTGVNRENVVMIRFKKDISKHYQSFKNEVLQVPGISKVATGRDELYTGYSIFSVTTAYDKTPRQLAALNVDDQFVSLLHIKWLIPPKGGEVYNDDHKIIVNEAAIGGLNLPANPVGEYIRLGESRLQVAGVVKNFVYSSLHDKIGAQALLISKDTAIGWGDSRGVLFARIDPHVNIPTVIESLRRIYTRYDTHTAFDFRFMDDVYNSAYKAEDRLADIFSLFTGLMIVIAGLGLFGLISFSAVQRTREIGIRKVLGASVQSIVSLMAKDFLLYILIAILIAAPVTLYAMSRWLENFAYKISPGWELFLGAALLTLVLALLTIGGIAFRAARANPVKNLRTE
ncbi:MAG: ABC transporter permease [Puia sp.]|nr:ABC transporter permease [Puia sp.]